jgi:Putative transposase of IS4/5 family (DUF4096)
MFALPQKQQCRGRARRIVFGLTPVIQAPKQGLRIMRYELACHKADAAQQAAWHSSGERPSRPQRNFLGRAPWRDLPEAFGPYTTCYNRFVRWRRAGVWSRIIDALAGAHDAAVQMIDTSIVRVHHQEGLLAGARSPRMNLPA